MVASDAREFAGVLRHAADVIPLKWPVDWCYVVRLAGRRVALVANGPGESLASEALNVGLCELNPAAVVSTGFCGALDPDLGVGDIVVASRVESLARARTIPGGLPATSLDSRTGVLLTSDRVVRTAAEKNALRNRGGDAVDMEAAALAESAMRHRIPFYSIRTVTDLADEDLYVDLNAARGPDGHFREWKIIFDSLKQPRLCLPQLWELRRRADLAAQRLGDFLAGCEFTVANGT